MDVGLQAQAVWVVGPGSAGVWGLAEAFLEEEALVSVVTTGGSGFPACALLPRRFGPRLRIVTVEGHDSLLAQSLLRALPAEPPKVIVLHRLSPSRFGPSDHEWDEFLRSHATDLAPDGAALVIVAHPAGQDSPEGIQATLALVGTRYRMWSGFVPPDRALSLISLSEAAGDTREISLLGVFLATAGRNGVALVDDEGLVQMI